MFCPLDGKSVDSVVVDHVGDAGEGSAELTQDIVTTGRHLDPHVHISMHSLEAEAVVLSSTFTIPDKV